MNNNFMILQGLQDKDTAAMKEWWEKTSDEVKVLVWDRIQVARADPVDEIVCRFAQVAFTQMQLQSKGASPC